jgi:phospholipase/carboxylesterase
VSEKITHFVDGRPENFDSSQPLVLLLHGYGSNEHDLVGLMNYLPGNFAWVSLRAPLDSQYGGYAWAPIISPGNPRAEDIEPATARLWSWIDQNIPAVTPLVLIGFSQGGLMATQLLRTRPERILATVILAGFVLNSDQPGDTKLEATKPAVIYCRGLSDQVISQDAVARTEAWLTRFTSAITPTYPGLGHSIDERVIQDVSEYLRDYA